MPKEKYSYEKWSRKADKEREQKLEEIRKKAQRGDVSYDLNRWFMAKIKEGDPELLEIRKQGYISEALKWLKSMVPEGMKYGHASRGQRLEKAKEFAKLADTTIEEIKKQHDIDLPE